MRSVVLIALMAAFAAVGCAHANSPANAYDNSATWAALNQSQAEGDFYNGMRKRLEKIDFVCTPTSEVVTTCVKRAVQAKCTFSEDIEFNSSGVSGYSLDKNCAA